MTQYPEAYLCRELGMAVVNISLITDYDAGVHEGTEAVNAMSVLEVFELNAARIQKVVLEMVRRFPADLDALGARRHAPLHPGRRPHDRRRGHPAVRDGPVGGSETRCPIGVSHPDDPGDAGLVARERPAARRGRLRRGLGLGPLRRQGRPDRAGRGVLDDPVSAAAAVTRAGDGRHVRDQRHEPPSGRPRPDGDHAPDRERRPARPRDRDRRPPGRARGARDPVPRGPRAGRPAGGGDRGHARAVDRRAGHPAVAVLPAPGRRGQRRRVPSRRRSSSVARPRAGARLAGPDRRWLDGLRATSSSANLPAYLEALEAAGRRRADQRLIVGLPGRRLAERRAAGRQPAGSRRPRETWARWREAGADGAIVTVPHDRGRRRARRRGGTLVAGIRRRPSLVGRSVAPCAA